MNTTFTISNPTLKKGAVLKYTSYTITTTTGASSPSEVQRRYRDFLWLHETLRTRNSGCIIPPLPKKKFLGRFHPSFIENRIRGMDNFLTKVLTHPVLGHELYVHTFLETNDMAQVQKIAESCQNSDDSNSGVMNWLQTQKNVLTASESGMVKSQVLIETESRLSPILEHMENAVKYAPRVVETSLSMQKQQKNIAALRQKRAEACEELYQADHLADGVPIPALQQFSTSELALVSITDNYLNSLDLEVMEPLQRHKDTVFALRASVTSQRNKKANHIAANSAIQRDSVRNPNHEEHVAKASRCLNEYVAASNRLDEDYCRYQEERTEELLRLLRSLVSLQAQHCQQSQVVWTELETSLKADAPLTPPSLIDFSTSTDRGVANKVEQPVTSLLDLNEDEDEEGRDSDFYESV